MAINLKAARPLGLTVPEALLACADEIAASGLADFPVVVFARAPERLPFTVRRNRKPGLRPISLAGVRSGAPLPQRQPSNLQMAV